MLLAYGADAYLKNNAGETPQSMVEQYPASQKAHKDKIVELIEGAHVRMLNAANHRCSDHRGTQ